MKLVLLLFLVSIISTAVRGGKTSQTEILHKEFPGPTTTFHLINETPHKSTIYCKGKYAYFTSTQSRYGRSWARNYLAQGESIEYVVPSQGGFYCSVTSGLGVVFVRVYSSEEREVGETVYIRGDGVWRGNEVVSWDDGGDEQELEGWLSRWMKKRV